MIFSKKNCRHPEMKIDMLNYYLKVFKELEK